MFWMPLLLIIPLIGILGLMIFPALCAQWTAVSVTAANLLLVLGRLVGLYGRGPGSFMGVLQLTGLGLFITCITLFVGFTATLYSTHYMKTAEFRHPADKGRTRTYFLLVLVFYFTLTGVPLFENAVLTWVFIEATALASVLLVDFHRTKGTIEASWKYLIIMEFGGLCALFGTLVLLFAQPHQAVASTWTELQQVAPQISHKALQLAFVLGLVGYGAKTGLTPFHYWLPDAHSQAPSPVSGMLSGIKLNCAFYGVLRFMSVADAGGIYWFAHAALLVLGVATVLVAVLMMISQHDYKRLFAYSSSENMGMIAIGFSLGPIGALGGFLQMINHSLIKSMLFYQSGELLHATGTTDMKGLRGVARVWPWAGGTLMLAMLAIAGAPPFGLFISELIIVYALFHSAVPLLGVLVLLLLIILFASFLRYAMQIGYGEGSQHLDRFRERYGKSWASAAPFGVHIALVLAFGMLLPFGISALHLLSLG